MALPAIPIISGIVSLFKMGGGLFTNWQERKLIKAKGKLAIETAKVEHDITMAEQGLIADIQADKSIIDQMSFTWKDEYLTLLFTIPAVLAFIPGMADYAKAGFEALKEMPMWYQILLILVAASGLGLRKFVEVLIAKLTGS